MSEVPHAGPREGQLDRPALAPAGRIIQSPVDVDGRAEPREIPVEEGPSRPPRVGAPPEVVVGPVEVPREREGLAIEQIELGDVEPASAAVGVSPDEEDL